MLQGRFWFENQDFGVSFGAICIIFRATSFPTRPGPQNRLFRKIVPDDQGRRNGRGKNRLHFWGSYVPAKKSSCLKFALRFSFRLALLYFASARLGNPPRAEFRVWQFHIWPGRSLKVPRQILKAEIKNLTVAFFFHDWV